MQCGWYTLEEKYTRPKEPEFRCFLILKLSHEILLLVNPEETVQYSFTKGSADAN